MTRSSFKCAYVPLSLVRGGALFSSEGFKVSARGSFIVPEFVGKEFAIHNGKKWIRVFITEDMVGHKFGDFSWSRPLSVVHKR